MKNEKNKIFKFNYDFNFGVNWLWRQDYLKWWY